MKQTKNRKKAKNPKNPSPSPPPNDLSPDQINLSTDSSKNGPKITKKAKVPELPIKKKPRKRHRHNPKPKEPKMKFRLIDLPKHEMKQIRYMFQKDRIPFFKNLLIQLMRRTAELPERLAKLFGSFINDENTPVSWEIFLQVLEAEMNFIDEKGGGSEIDYGSKTIYLREPAIVKNMSQQPTKFFHPQYQLKFCEYITLANHKLAIVVVNKSTLCLMNDSMSKIFARVNFSRDFGRHEQGKLHRRMKHKKRLEEEEKKRTHIRRRLEDFGDSEPKMGPQEVSYDFDVMLYAGLKKGGRAAKNRERGSRRHPNHRRKRAQNGQNGRDRRNDTFSDMEEATTTFGSEMSRTRSRQSFRSRMNTNDSFVETMKSQVSSRANSMVRRPQPPQNGVGGLGSHQGGGAASQNSRNHINNGNNGPQDRFLLQEGSQGQGAADDKLNTFLSKQNSPRSRGARSQIQNRSKRFSRVQDVVNLPTISTSVRRNTKLLGAIADLSLPENSATRRLNRSLKPGIPRQRRPSNRKNVNREYLLQGLTEKAAIENLFIDLKNKLNGKLDSYEYSEKEGREIKKMFEKFKVIAEMDKLKASLSSTAGQSSGGGGLGGRGGGPSRRGKRNNRHINRKRSIFRPKEGNEKKQQSRGNTAQSQQRRPTQMHDRHSQQVSRARSREKERSRPSIRTKDRSMDSKRMRTIGSTTHNREADSRSSTIYAARKGSISVPKNLSKNGSNLEKTESSVQHSATDKRENGLKTITSVASEQISLDQTAGAKSKVVTEEGSRGGGLEASGKGATPDESAGYVVAGVGGLGDEDTGVGEMYSDEASEVSSDGLDFSFEDIDDYAMKLDDQIKLKKEKKLIKQIDFFQKNVSSNVKVLNLVGHICNKLDGKLRKNRKILNVADLEPSDPNFDREIEKNRSTYKLIKQTIEEEQIRRYMSNIKNEIKLQRKFGEKIYDYSKFSENNCNNNGSGTELEITACYYWKHLDILLLAMLTRELFSYKVHYDRTQRMGLSFVKLEEIRTSHFYTKMNIFKSILGKNKFFFMTISHFNTIKIYALDAMDSPGKLLSRNIQRNKLKFVISIKNIITASHMFRGGLVYSSMKNNIYVINQVETERFRLLKKVKLKQKFTSTTISALCFGKSTALLMVGTTVGEFYVYDIDISKVVFKYKDHNAKIIEIRYCEGLKNIYIFWENHKAKVMDALTYEIMQEMEDLEAAGQSNFVYMTDIDEILDSPITLKEKEAFNSKNGGAGKGKTGSKAAKKSQNEGKGEETALEKFSEILAKPIRWKRLVTQIRKGKACIIFGSSRFSIYNLYIRADKEFKEMLSNFKKVNEMALEDLAGDEEAQQILNKVYREDFEWIHIAVDHAKSSIVLVNEKKFLVYYSFAESKTLKHSMIDIQGQIIRLDIIEAGKKLLIANREGDFVLYNLTHMSKMLEVSTPLTSVIWVEPLDDVYQMVFFNEPDEVICLRRMKGINQSFKVKELQLGVNMDAFRLTSAILLVRSFSLYIICLQETFKMVVFKRKNMKVQKEFDLLEHFTEQQMLRYPKSSFYQYIQEVTMIESILYIHFDGGRVIILKFNENSISDLTVHSQLLNYQFLMGIEAGGGKLIALDEAFQLKFYDYTPENYITYKQVKDISANKEIMKKLTNYQKRSNSSMGVRQLAAKLLNKTGDALTEERTEDLAQLVEDYNNEVATLRNMSSFPRGKGSAGEESEESLTSADGYLLNNYSLRAANKAMVEKKKNKQKRKEEEKERQKRAGFDPKNMKLEKILKLVYIKHSNKLALVMRKGPMFLVDSNVSDIGKLDLVKEVKMQSQNEMNSRRSLKEMVQERKRRQMIRKTTSGSYLRSAVSSASWKAGGGGL